MIPTSCVFAISICIMVFIIFVSKSNTFKNTYQGSNGNGWGGSASSVALQTTSGIMGQNTKPFQSLDQILYSQDNMVASPEEVKALNAPVVYDKPFDDNEIKYPRVNLGRKSNMSNYGWDDQNIGSYKYPYIDQKFPCKEFGNCRSIPT